MQIETYTGPAAEIVCDALIINVFAGNTGLDGASESIDKALNGVISLIIRDQADSGKHGNITIQHTCGKIGAKRVILVGLGKQEEFSADSLRTAAGVAMRAASHAGAKNVAVIMPDTDKVGLTPLAAGQAVTEGSLLGSYQFRYYKSVAETTVTIEKLSILTSDAAKITQIQTGTHTGQIIADAVNMARDMVNHPANHMTPTIMASQAKKIAAQYGLEISILEKDRLEELHMSAFLAVAQGSNEAAKLIILKYHGTSADNHLLALVGKGITFDSGGISLKPSEGLHEMKDDMAGGATVLAAVQAIAALKLPINLLAAIPCTENLPSGNAYKPGDVITSMAGKTIEVISTDAEGRLVLADAITYVRQLGATQIIDLATLTGACVVALGNITSGLMGNDAALIKQILAAANQTGERMWELPMFPEYKEQIKSNVADMKNSGGRPAGAITAGLFIANFADKTPWAHIDIAGTSTSDKETGYNVKGATGAAVRTLVQLARDWKVT